MVNECIVDEDEKVVANVFGGVTRELPTVAGDITVREVATSRPSLWWLPQDLALGGGLILSALRVAVQLQLIPVLERAAVAEADEIALLTAVEVSVPSYVTDAPQRRPAIVAIRGAMIDLAAGSVSPADIRRAAGLIEQLGHDFPGDHTRAASIALLRFPHLEGSRDHPALLVADLGWRAGDIESEPSRSRPV